MIVFRVTTSQEPQVARLAGRVLAIVEIVVPGLGRGVHVRTVEIGLVPRVGEFADVARPAQGAVDVHVPFP